jgi:HD-GYP domain-containing protein (c-di-GMP phosphodiesterase class II)
VGKIGLADRSLASGHLDMSDAVLVRMHPLIGLAILQPVEFLAPTLDAVRHHHERWDGKGYPDGLAGEDIPLPARILAIANLYDNLQTDAPGRPGLSEADAVKELRAAAGRECDPELTEKFLAALGTPAGEPARPERKTPSDRSSV